MSIYLERYAYPTIGVKKPPLPTTGLIIVLPVFNEQHTIKALESLLQSSLPSVNVEVLIIINQSIDCEISIKAHNKTTLNNVTNWIARNPKEGIQYYAVNINLQKKHAGVGLARKAGMDEAARRFELIGNNKGVILCYDADCTCANNYIKEAFNSFEKNNLNAASINFEHKLETLPPIERNGIVQYELHLRYYINGLRKAGYPYAFHTIGSSMAVRADVYMKAGGMNRRKAGEDFHFLHKVIPYGNFDEITSTSVYPSARTSDRVPFGTGKAMGDWLVNGKDFLVSYHPQIFTDLSKLLKKVPEFYKNQKIENTISSLPKEIQSYLIKEDFGAVMKEINTQSKNINTFLHRWFNWFNGLRALHLVHYLRDHYYPSIPVAKAASILVHQEKLDTLQLLAHYQQMDIDFKADQISLKHLYHAYL